MPSNRDARPSLEEALALRQDAMALVRRVVDRLTDEQLAEQTAPLAGPGWPDEGETFPVRSSALELADRRGRTGSVDVVSSSR